LWDSGGLIRGIHVLIVDRDLGAVEDVEGVSGVLSGS